MVESPLSYTGSKYKLLNQILPEFDYSKDYFVDLFAGGGSVFANVLDKYKKVLVNDIITDLIWIHQHLLMNPVEFVDEVKSLVVSKEDQDGYNKLRESYNSEPTPAKLWACMLCSTNNMLRFNQKMKYNQTFGKRTFNASTQSKVDKWTAHIANYKDKIQFTATHFKNIHPSNTAMVYIDSPYTNSEAGYNAFWSKNDDIILYDYCNELDKNGCSFVLSGILGEHKDGKRWELIDKLIDKGYTYKVLDHSYEKVARNKNTKNSEEIIIKNF